jgi:hypothetical protein
MAIHPRKYPLIPDEMIIIEKVEASKTKSIRFYNLEIIRYISFVLFISLTAIRCTNEDSGPTLPTPTKLEIVSTLPADGGIGPFNLYTPKPDTVKPHFIVYFNKSMKSSTMNFTTVTCEGYDQPVMVKVLNRVPSNHGNAVGFQIVNNSGPHSGVPATYRINATYTITIDSTVEDNLGNQLGHHYKFSFKPEPYFRVVGFNFNDGDTTIPSSLEIFFNSKLTSQTMDSITISPVLSNDRSINSTTDSSSVLFQTYDKVMPSTTYTIAVASNATDLYGNVLHQGIQRSFVAPPLTITHNQFGSNNVNLAAQINLYFNYPMNVSSITSAFSLDPHPQLVQSAGARQLSFYATNDFDPDTDYTISLSTQLMTTSGYYLSSPITLPFHTANFSMSHLPANGETNVSTYNIIELDFSGAIVTSTVANAITVSPPIDHRLEFQADTPGKFIYVYFVPTNPLPPNTRYQVIVSNTIESIGGYYLAQPDTFYFRTGF